MHCSHTNAGLHNEVDSYIFIFLKEDNLSGRRPKNGDDLTGRQPHRKTTSHGDKLSGRMGTGRLTG